MMNPVIPFIPSIASKRDRETHSETQHVYGPATVQDRQFGLDVLIFAAAGLIVWCLGVALWYFLKKDKS